jgi:hypothetical protein
MGFWFGFLSFRKKSGILFRKKRFILGIGNVVDSIKRTDKIPCRVRAKDMQNLLLLLPFLLHNLVEEEVEGYNPFDPITDPSDQCIGIVLLLIDWYHLFRRHYPPKDELDIQDLQGLSLGYASSITYGTYF